MAERKQAELLERLRCCFRRVEPFVQARKYVRAVLSELPKRNGWSIAEHVGDRTPDRTQRLLNRASWDDTAAMAEVRRFAVSGLEQAARKAGRRRGRLVIGALDETGAVLLAAVPATAAGATPQDDVGIQSCYGSATNYSVPEGEYFFPRDYPGGAWLWTTTNCADINIRPDFWVKVRVCFDPSWGDPYCQSTWKFIEPFEWGVIASDVRDGTRFKIEFDYGGPATGNYAA